MNRDSLSAAESVYVARGDSTPDLIATSLQALLPTRHHPIVRHRFTVLDTFDGRIRRAGARLIQAGNSESVEWQPGPGGSRVAARLNAPAGFAWDLPEGPLKSVLAPVIGVRRLLALADAEAYGSELDVLDERRKTIARVRIESGQVRLPRAGSHWQSLPTMVTLTGLRGYEDAYERLVPVLESRPGLTSCPEGVQGLMLRRLGAPEPHDSSLPLVDLDRSVRADTGIRRIHLGLLRLVAENEAGVRAGIDTEFLHDFRVTVRRTRALLGQIRHVLPSDAVEHFSAEFSWLGRLAGPPRDLDVLVLRLRQNRGEVPADDMDMLLAHFGVMQRREHVTLVRALESPRYRRLLTQWKSFLEQPSSSGSESRNAARPLVEVVSKRAWRLYGRIAKGGAGIDGETPAGRVHELRIDAKKLRYLIDVTPSFYAVDDLESIVGTLKKLQRVLGDFNDAHVQETVLLECGRAMAEAGAPAGALMTVGRLAEQRRQSGCRLRAEIADRLARFRAGKARSACRRAFKTAHTEERR